MSSKDSETEVEKGALASSVYAQGVASGLDAEREPMLSASASSFVKEVQTGLQDFETAAKDVVGASDPEEEGSDSDFEEFWVIYYILHLSFELYSHNFRNEQLVNMLYDVTQIIFDFSRGYKTTTDCAGILA